MKIDIHSKSVETALCALREILDTGPSDKLHILGWKGAGTHAKRLEHAFEIEYNCKIICEDQFGLQGYLEFNEPKYATAFVLRFGANDIPKEQVGL